MKVPLQVSMVLRYLHQVKGETLQDLVEAYPQYKRTTIFRHMKKTLNDTGAEPKKRTGRPPKVTDRDRRQIFAATRKLKEEYGTFNATHIRRRAGVTHLAPRTVRRVLNTAGYKYKQCRKKGILLKGDLKKRLQFARKCKKLPQNFWKEGIAFYLDGVSFVHKTNPCDYAKTCRTRTYMRKGEELDIHNTAKGKKEGVGSRTAKFFCAIAYGRGFMECHHYTERLNGEFCEDYIRERFPEMFEASANPRGKLFLQDGDPNQNSAAAKLAMDAVGCRLFKIPARSPDLNPIENAFHNIRRKLNDDALEGKIECETFQQFCRRVRNTILDYSAEVIDRTIDSMPKRIDLVIKNKGIRTKY